MQYITPSSNLIHLYSIQVQALLESAKWDTPGCRLRRFRWSMKLAWTSRKLHDFCALGFCVAFGVATNRERNHLASRVFSIFEQAKVQDCK